MENYERGKREDPNKQRVSFQYGEDGFTRLKSAMNSECGSGMERQ